MLFPEIVPDQTGFLSTGDGHELYWQACGNSEGLPLLFLHGGPGSGVAPKYLRMFDPERFRIIALDQRGAGRSRPHASLEGNTTQNLIKDIEALRQHLGLEQWTVFGPSWGSTLALAYAQTHPARVRGLVVEAIFTATRGELDWWHSLDGVPRFYPDAWADFITPIPSAHRHSPAAVLDWCYQDMLAERAGGYETLSRLQTATLEEIRQSTLYRWTELEDRISFLETTPEQVFEDLRMKGADFIISHSLIEAHYFKHDCFLREGQLIEDAHTLADIPMAILHSRYDMVCPPQSAFKLAAACPHAEFVMIGLNGHGMTEPAQIALNGIMDRLVERI